jgi:transaldolase
MRRRRRVIIADHTFTNQTVVCDSGDFGSIAKYKPQDATTNPSLILAAAKMPEYAKLIDASIKYGKEHGQNEDDQIDSALDRLLVEFGREILQIVPGKVSTEVDARFSFSTEATVKKALHIIDVRRLPAGLPTTSLTPYLAVQRAGH